MLVFTIRWMTTHTIVCIFGAIYATIPPKTRKGTLMRTKTISAIVIHLVFFALPTFAATPPGHQEIKVVTTGVRAYAGVQAGSSDVLTDILLESLMTRHGLRALGPSDIQALLSVEQQKALLGCTDESCMTELAGALGADWLIAGSVGMLEDMFVLSLQLIEAKSAKVTSRSTTTLQSLKEAPEKIGPLVDKLLGSRPKIKVPPNMLNQPVADQKPAMEKQAFCKKVEAYQKQVMTRPFVKKLTAMRKELLQDLVVTRFEREFVGKQSCFWEVYGQAEGAIRTQLYGAKHNLYARDAKLRLKELIEFGEQQKTLKEAYQRGLELEKNGTGTRLLGLPFEITPTSLTQLPNTLAYRNYRKAYHRAEQMLAKALRAAQRGNQKEFLSFFTPDDPKRSRTSPAIAFEGLQSKFKNGYRFETCPFDVMYEKAVERAVEKFTKEGLTECCWRYKKDNYVSTDTVWVKLHQGKWLIEKW